MHLPDDIVAAHVLPWLKDGDFLNAAATCHQYWRLDNDVEHRVERDVRVGHIHLLPQKPSFVQANVMIARRKLRQEDMSLLGMAQDVRLFNCNVHGVDALCNCDHVLLSQCRPVKNVSPLRSVRSVTLCNMTLSDVGALGSVHALQLRHMHAVSDVSALGSTHSIFLCSMPLVTDVSALGGVHTLELLDMNVNGVHAPTLDGSGQSHACPCVTL
jgi:hypothetical protein